MAFTKITLSADDAKNLAIGKALSMVAGALGLVAGMYTIMANPVAKANVDAAWKKLPVPMQQNKAFTFALAGFAGAAIIAKLVVNSQNKKANPQ